MQLEELQYGGVILELNVHCAKYKSSSDTLNKMMSALEKMLQILNTVYPRSSAHSLIGALPRISVHPLLHQGSYNQESYIQGFSNSGVHISVSYMTGLCPDFDIDRCSLHSGVQINVSYMTGLWPDVDTNRTILRSGVCVDRKFYI